MQRILRLHTTVIQCSKREDVVSHHIHRQDRDKEQTNEMKYKEQAFLITSPLSESMLKAQETTLLQPRKRQQMG